ILLTHALGSKDLHMENIVASRGGPVLIDLEMLLQPGGEATDESSVDRSCLRTGLLSVIEFGANEAPNDIGGLRGSGVRTTGAIQTAVILKGDRQLPDGYATEILDGFTGAYDFVRAHRSDLLAVDGPLAAFERGTVRVLVRPTNQYGM